MVVAAAARSLRSCVSFGSSRLASVLAAAELNSHTQQECQSLPLKDALDWLEQQGRGVRHIYALLLRRCSSERALVEGKRVHDHIVKKGWEHDRFLANHLMQMYGQSGGLNHAEEVFHKLADRNVYSWTIIISACIQNGHANAFKLFRKMQLEGTKPDQHVLSTILCGSSAFGDIAEGKAIHASIADSMFATSDVVVGNSLLRMYSKCGSLEDAASVFSRMMFRDEISWTTMISLYVQGGRESSAVKLLRYMDWEGRRPNKVAYASLVDGCASLAALSQGKWIHARIVASGLEMDVVLETALVNMYGKCGRVAEARSLFDAMRERNVISWTAIVAAYAQNGHCSEALKLFWRMEQEGSRADGITLTHVLYACNHAGLVEQACHYFTSMRTDRGIALQREHYGCVIDLLARAGWLAETEEFMNKIHIRPDAASWMALLGACRIHGDVDRGARAAERVFELDPKRASPYNVLSNMYSAANKWDLPAPGSYHGHGMTASVLDACSGPEQSMQGNL